MPKRTLDDLLDKLAEQIDFLESSCLLYDQGKVSEAKRLALHIRVLTHDSGKAVSLLSQLGRKTSMGFWDSTSSNYDPRNLLTYMGLVALRVASKGPLIVPLLDPFDSGRLLPFDDWCNKIVFKDNIGTTFTRGQIVMFVVDKDGGAHVDPKISPDYQDLTQGESTGWEAEYNDGSREFVPRGELAMVRQIAHELLTSLQLNQVPNASYKEPSPSRPIKPNTIGRNDPCHYGSGQKYKRCHGRIVNLN